MKPSEAHAPTKILLTSISAMVAETTTFPIDLTKTRLQLHGESRSVGSTRPTNAFRVASEIVRREGPLGLYKGLSPAILRHLFYTPIRIVGYEHLRNSLKTDGGSLSFFRQGRRRRTVRRRCSGDSPFLLFEFLGFSF